MHSYQFLTNLHMNTSPKHVDQEITASKDSTNPGVDIVSPRPEESGNIPSAADDQLAPMRATSQEQIAAASQVESTLTPEQEKEAAFQSMKREMQQIIMAKIDELDIQEDTPQPELEKMIWDTSNAILYEHPELMHHRDDNALRAKYYILYSIPALVNMKAAQIIEKDPMRSAFYLSVFTQYLKFVWEPTIRTIFFEETLPWHKAMDKIYHEKNFRDELRKVCPEYIAFKNQARELIKQFLQDNDNNAYKILYAEFIKDPTGGNGDGIYPLIKHVDYKGAARQWFANYTRSEEEACHIAGTGSIFWAEGIMQRLADGAIPYPRELYALEVLSSKAANETYEMLYSSDGKRIYGRQWIRDGKPGMKGSEIAKRLRQRLETFATTGTNTYAD